MQEIKNIRDIQRLEYNILCHAVDFFEKNDMLYLLSGGTLLGAVRHAGFIPWDDDIDIWLPREDYERFKKMVRDGLFDSDFMKVMLPGDKGYRYPFIKIVDSRTKALEGLAETTTNIWIDVFPLDHFPDRKFAHFRAFSSIKMQDLLLTGCIVHGSKKHSLIKQLLAFVLNIFCQFVGGAEKVAISIDRQGLKMDQKYCESQYCGDGVWPIGLRDYFPVKWLFPVTKISFEGREFNIPCKYHEYLTHFYGDYMTPPPEDQRYLQHHVKAWWLPEENMRDCIANLPEDVILNKE